jgi:undecaprenyl-diphosphatase
VAAEPQRPVRDAVVGVLGGTPPTLVRPPVDPAAAVLPEPLARAVASFDTTVDAWFDRLRSHTVPDKLFYGASAVGDFSLIWHIAGVARALAGPRQEREAVRLAAALGIESVLINGVVKSWFRRTRPAWDQPRARKLRKPRSSSFPSGHATSGFMAATLLGAGRSKPTKALWLGAATIVSVSRVHVRIHHASDVAAGAVIGVGIGAIVKRMWPEGNVRGGRGY